MPPLDLTTAPVPITVHRVPNCQPRPSGMRPANITSHVMMGTAPSALARFLDPAQKASSNFALRTDGTVWCFVPPDEEAWANGRMRAPALYVPQIRAAWAGHHDPNAFTISVEWEGVPKQIAPGAWAYSEPYTDPRTNISEQVPTLARHGLLQPWAPTLAQYDAGVRLYRWLLAAYSIPADRNHLLRHSDWDNVARWYCPGPSFPLAQLITDLGGQVNTPNSSPLTPQLTPAGGQAG